MRESKLIEKVNAPETSQERLLVKARYMLMEAENELRDQEGMGHVVLSARIYGDGFNKHMYVEAYDRRTKDSLNPAGPSGQYGTFVSLNGPHSSNGPGAISWSIACTLRANQQRQAEAASQESK